MTMTNSSWQEVKELLHRAMQLAPEERERFLDDACSSNASLRAEVESLLAANDDLRSTFLAASPLELILPAHPNLNLANDLAEGEYFAQNFRLMRKLGEGGMGQVWLAEQTSPVKRSVAVKLIKAGMYDETVVHRFQVERQSLAIMDHPAIAKVFDAGTTPQGQPYFVMEFVPGLPLTQYCDEKKLTIRERLDLFILACEGIQHAHQKAVIHRDLKPANILVVEVDDKPTPRIIDFGLAKPSNPAAEMSMITQFGNFVGTPGYMSPEQLDPTAQDVDTRTDVYSLGVILYELLTGSPPFEQSERRKRPFDEFLRMLREDEPARPSTRVSSDRQGSVITAEARRTEAGKLAVLLRGDLDWITMKALEKDRVRRYASAAGLAGDIRRYLNDEPILARSPSAGYQMQKFFRRHRSLVGSLAVVFVALIVATAASMVMAVRASRAREAARNERDRSVQAEAQTRTERDRAAAAEESATRQRDLALEAKASAVREQNRALAEKKRADDQAATATAISNFLQNDLLSQASAHSQERAGIKPDPEIKVRTALDRAATRIQGKFDDRPLVEASIRQTIGVSYREIGVYPEAQKQLERSLELKRRTLGNDDPETLTTMEKLAALYHSEGKLQDAEALYRQILASDRRIFGGASERSVENTFELATVLSSEQNYKESLPLLKQSLVDQRRLFGEANLDTLETEHAIATVYTALDQYPEAETILLHTLEQQQALLGDSHRDTLLSMQLLANVYWSEAKFAKAEPLLSRALEVQRERFGSEDRDTLYGMNTLALLYELEGKLSQSQQLFEEALTIERRSLGAEHIATQGTMQNLASVYEESGQYKKAEVLTKETLEIRRRTLGAEHRDTLSSMNNLANVYFSQGLFAEAQPIYERVLEARQRLQGNDDRQTMNSMNNLAELYRMIGKYDEAERLGKRALESRKRVLGLEDPATLESLNGLGAIYVATNRYAEAEPLLTQAMELRKKVLGAEHPDTLSNTEDVAELRRRQGDPAVAESLLTTVMEARARVLGPTSPDTLEAMWLLGEVRLEQKKYAEAESLLRQALAGYEKSSADSWQLFRCKALLGESLAELGRYPDSEPMLIEGQNGLRRTLATIPFEEHGIVKQTELQIVELYKNWGKPEKLAEWQARIHDDEKNLQSRSQ